MALIKTSIPKKALSSSFMTSYHFLCIFLPTLYVIKTVYSDSCRSSSLCGRRPAGSMTRCPKVSSKREPPFVPLSFFKAFLALSLQLSNWAIGGEGIGRIDVREREQLLIVATPWRGEWRCHMFVFQFSLGGAGQPMHQHCTTSTASTLCQCISTALQALLAQHVTLRHTLGR